MRRLAIQPGAVGTRSGSSRGTGERGQAMTEFAVILTTFLVPLFMTIPLLAQTVSIRQDAETAVRYSAFQRAVWKGTNAEVDTNFQATEPGLAPSTVKADDTIAKEVDTRIFASGDSQIYTTENNAVLTLKPFDMTSLSAPAGTQQSLLDLRTGSNAANPRYASQASTDSALTGVEGQLITNGITNSFNGLRFNLNTNGSINAKVNFQMIQIPDWIWPTQALGVTNLTMSRSLTLYTDGWTPGGRADERYRIAGLLDEELNLDTPAIHNVQNKFSPTIAKIIRCNTYESDCYLDFGYTNVDAVPSSRLTN